MKLLFDFLPIILFFVVFKREGVFAATLVAVAATILQAIYSKVKNGKVETMQLVSCGLMVLFGGATLISQDETFVKWKPTVLNLLFGLAFLGSQFIGEKTLVERMMSKALTLPKPVWTRLNLSWVTFFCALALANLYVVYNFDTETWVNFKLFGMLGLTFGFVLLQGLFLHRYLDKGGTTPGGTTPPQV